MSSSSHEVGPSHSGATLLDFLAARQNLSRRKAKELLDRHDVFVNGRRVWMARHRLRMGDVVRVAGAAACEPQPPALQVLHQDAHLVVLNKPPGLLSNGPNSAETAAQVLLKNPALRAVHRLDRGTSGCLLMATTEKAAKQMITLFRECRIVKMYHALVLGPVRARERTVCAALDHQPAVTHYRVLDANALASHLLLRIETGRTHQIRRHLVGLGHPVLGDRDHGTGRRLPEALQDVTRQMLHASRIAFPSPFDGHRVDVRAPLPKDFSACLHRLGLQ